MVDYEEIYKILFNAITEAIYDIEDQEYQLALKCLIQAQRLAEEAYIQADETIDLLNLPQNK